MFDLLYEKFNILIGLNSKDLTLYHMIFRFLIVYFFGIIVLNFINKRFIGEKTPFDVILRFIIGSALANGITGNSPFFATIGMVFFIIILNWILSFFTLYNELIDKILKGNPFILYQNNKFNFEQMRKHHFTKEDLLSEVRKITGIDDLKEIKTIILENSGEISVMPYATKIKVHNTVRNDIDDF